MSTLKTPEADALLSRSKWDSNEDLLSDVTINGKKHALLLNKHHEPTREKKQQKKTNWSSETRKRKFMQFMQYLPTSKKTSKISVETIHIILAGQL